jgi:predicted Fe-Mo cluster-binding NifX family protein
VDAVACQGLGRRAFAGLAAAGIPVYVADEPDVASVIARFRAGQLELLEEQAACRGGHGHQHHGHEEEGVR